MTDLGDAFAGFLIIVGIALVVTGVMFLFAIIGTAIGAFVGWVISITPLSPFVEQGFEAFGVPATGLLPHIGATLGFVGGLLKGIIQVEHKKEKN